MARGNDDAIAVADRLHSAAIHLLRLVAREDPKSGLSAARLSALSVVVFAGPLPLGELAAAERVRPPTMTRIVQALEREGLVRRAAEAGDRRVVRVVATPKGRRVLARARSRRVAGLAACLQPLPLEDVAVLARAAELIEATVADGPGVSALP
jgi:DNA-binding MarR family transcriptional regulator